MESTEEMIIECAWCRKIKINGTWVTDPLYIANNPGKDITHGICPNCSHTSLSKFHIVPVAAVPN